MDNQSKQVTVGELIERLKQYDPNLPVLTDGYESGYESEWEIRVFNVFYRGPKGYTDGDYAEEAHADDGDTLIKALVIGVNEPFVDNDDWPLPTNNPFPTPYD